MFTNLKNKIFDEVKASPAKFQQFAQAAQAAVSSASSTSESVSGSDNFFSITEEDTPQNSPLRNNKQNEPVKQQSVVDLQNMNSSAVLPLNNGVTSNRSRKLSNSSMASDVSFRLPSYESPAVYHLQSDLDISGSEYDDAGSTTSRLDVISKEQLHDAYRKALDRYHKYRSRYTDLAKKYRDLERDSTKARSVLVETQDKAIRRISELREQCTLEQQAKAHLEEALRMEMDDMQCKINSYQTKLKLLGESPENVAAITSNHLTTNNDTALIKLDTDNNLINLNAENIPLQDNLNEKIKQLEEQLIEKSDEIVKLNSELHMLNKSIESFKKREEENTIILAQNKLEIHSELENKESAMKKLKSIITDLENKYHQSEKDNNQFRTQANQLIEIKEKLKLMTEAKQEFEAKSISHDHIVGEMKKLIADKDKSMVETKKQAEDQLKKISTDYDHKLQALKDQNETLSAMLEQNNIIESNMTQIDNELNRTKIENNSLTEKLSQINCEKIALQNQLDVLKNQLNDSLGQIEIKQNEENDFKRENQEMITKINELTKTLKEFSNVKESNENHIKQLEDELTQLREQYDKIDTETVVALKKTESDLNNQIKFLQDQILSKETDTKSLIEEIEQLKIDKENMKSQKFIEKDSKHEKNLKSLKDQLKTSEHKLIKIQNESQTEIMRKENENLNLKSQNENLLKEFTDLQTKLAEMKASHSTITEEKRYLIEKIELMQNESQHETSEANQRWQALIKDNETKLRQVEQQLHDVEAENSQLEKLIAENDGNLKKENANFKELLQRSELELSDLRMKYETEIENVRKLNEKNAEVLDENSQLHNAKEIMEHEYRSLQDQCEEREKEKLCVLDSNKCLESEMVKLREEIQSLTTENSNNNESITKLQKELFTLTTRKQTDKEKREKLQNDLKQMQKSKESLDNELITLKEKFNEVIEREHLMKESQDENLKLKEIINQKELECKNLKSQITNLNQQFVGDVNKLEKSYKEKIETAESEINALQEKLSNSCKKNDSLKEQNDSFKRELDTLNNQNQARLQELENLLKETNDQNQTLQQSVLNATDFEKKLQNYEQLKIENEYLNKLTNQLETDIRKQKEDKLKSEEEINQLKIKMKSQQCELYVLTEGKEKHEADLMEKMQIIGKLEGTVKNLNEILVNEREDLRNQTEHCNFISKQNDDFQKQLLRCQTKLQDAEKLCNETKISYEEVINENINHKKQLELLKNESSNEVEKLRKEKHERKNSFEKLKIDLENKKSKLEKLEKVEKSNVQLKTQIKNLEAELSEKINSIENIQKENSIQLNARDENHKKSENLLKLNEELQTELSNFKSTSSLEISNLKQEIENLTINSKNLTDKLAEFDVLQQQAANLTIELEKLKQQNEESNCNNNNNNDIEDVSVVKQEREDLQIKLNKIMNDVQDVSNRNLFLEQKCENFLILEQSNERLKLANQKLLRQLDETLVSMQHNHEGIQANTEFEYLKNIMFQYLTGTVNGNNETLVKVIAAVLKFSPQQTQVAIEKEHQKHSLLGQFNHLL